MSNGLNPVRPLARNYFFLATLILGILSWGLSLVAQSFVVANIGNAPVGTLWFAAALQIIIIIALLLTLLSNTLPTHRHQLSTFTILTILLAAIGVNNNLYDSLTSQKITAAAWIITAVIDGLWVLFFTMEQESPLVKVFEALGACNDDDSQNGTIPTSIHQVNIGNIRTDNNNNSIMEPEQAVVEKLPAITRVTTNVRSSMAPPTRARRGTNAQLQLPLGTPGTQTQLSAVARSAPRTSPSPSGSRTSFISPNSMRSFPTTPRSPKATAINQRDVFAREPSSTRVPLGHNRRHSSVSHGPLSPGHSAQSSLGSSGVQSELSEQMSELELEMEYIPLEAPGTESIQMSEFKRSLPLNARQLETTSVNGSFPLSERELEALPMNSRGTRAIPLTELATVFDVASKNLPRANGNGISRSSNESKRASRVLLDGKRGSGVWSSKVWEDAAAQARAAEAAKASAEAKAREVKAAEEAKAREIKAAEEAKAREIKAIEQAKALAALERPRAPYKAEALFSYTGTSADPSELSFKKGEVLDVFNKSDQWWEARTADGKQGIAPSNYLKVIWRISLVESRRDSAATEARNSNTASLRQSRRESVVDSRNSVLWDAGRDSVVIESVTHAVAADATLEPVVVPKIVINIPPMVQEAYPYKAEALHSYTGDSEDPSELSFKKGDVLDILTKSDQWWEARTANGKKGIAPSNYLRLLTGRLDTVVEVDPTPSTVASPTETEPATIANIISEPQEAYPYKAEALFGYTASPDDSTELSFKKGELLDILTKSEQWWQARKQDGTRGIAPSNYLKLVVSTPPASPIQETKVTAPETAGVANVGPQEVYPYKAEALHAYTASPDDPAELSFKKGEVLDILNKSEQWWEARKVDGTKGIAPSNYLKITSRISSVPASETKEIPVATASTTSAIQDPYPFKAEALHSYTASPDDSTELSFKKGEVLDILTKSEQWWEARKLDGTKGIAPSNYLKEITPKATTVDDVPSSVKATQATESVPQETYPYKAEALYTYTGSPDDATEVSFKKGEILDVMTKSDLWWEVRKSNGTKGIAPSNYLKVVSRVRSVLPLSTRTVQQSTASTESLKTPTSAATTQEVYPYKAEALFAYTGSPDDQNELSFKKGEVLEILTKSDLWWEARKLDGTKGIAPSNYLKDLSASAPGSTAITSVPSAESAVLEAYPYKAEALFNYTASPDDSTELSFKKGEILDILTKSDLWWEARTLDGTKGIAPSNFLRLIEDVTPKSTKVVQVETNETYPYKAEALFAYTASPEDSTELSFKKGELLDILTKSDLWWEARKADGTKGIAPSNYLMEIGGIAPETSTTVKPYLCKAQALHAYTASPDDSTELSFRKGEMLEIFTKSDLWWEARKADGTTGIAPSNYLLAIEDGPQQAVNIPATVERVEQAEALFAYTASPDDPTELSFKKYEVLDILSKADIWWEARKADGTQGIAPSNYLKTITTASTQPTDIVETGSEVSEIYPFKARALHTYTASPDDSTELSFKKGEVLDILTKSDLWWEARKLDGTKGIAPSNYLQAIEDEAPIVSSTPIPREVYPYKAEALHAYSASPDDSTELSFKKGEILDILTKSDLWWEARKQDGTIGIAPSNYLLEIGNKPSATTKVASDDIYPYKASALHAYTASPDDPNELSFKKGEILEILTKTDLWWEARNMNGVKGIAPSNYLIALEDSSTPASTAPTEIAPQVSLEGAHIDKAEALYSYTASAEDPTELSFRKGEVLDILTKSDLWWEARKSNGTTGIAPSNFLRLLISDNTIAIGTSQVMMPPLEEYPFKAEALHAYTASAEDPSELSFKKGEVLDILTKSDLWWEARNSQGRKGIAPSNYLQLILSQNATPMETTPLPDLTTYPYKAEALHTYTASREDPTELSFKKGEVLDILTKSDLWWEARKSDGTKGIAPSNYLKLTSFESSSTNVTDPSPTEQTAKAEALYAYTASADDETELSFRKGEVLDILTQSDLWWEARKADGTIGIAPSNYLSLVATKSSRSLDEITLTEDIYPYRAQALHTYTASAEDPTELSFKKGEILEILTNSDLWWEARTANGKKGIAPSNYLELISSESTSLDTTELSTSLDEYPYQAEALHAYTASSEDPTELSFRKGEVLDILTKSDLWWEARKADGTRGIAPSNYLKLLTIVSTSSSETAINVVPEVYPHKAEALHAYTGSPDDENELSFRKGEILDILTISDLWWEAKNSVGKKGIAPSNYLKLISSSSTGENEITSIEEDSNMNEKYQAEALYAYTASPDDPNEVSFRKGEMFTVISKSDLWWEIRKSTGQRGIAPSNFLKLVEPVATESQVSVAPEEIYPYKAEALFAYTGSPDDPTELAFRKGEILEILTKSDRWWQARTLDGKRGIAPSNYLREISTVPVTLTSSSTTIESENGVASKPETQAEEFYPYKAEALYAYTGSSDDPRELSFRKGEVLDILTKSDMWWEARKSDGTKGIAPSNFLKIKSRVSSSMLLNSRRLAVLDLSNVGPSNPNNMAVTPVASSSQAPTPIVSVSPVATTSTNVESINIKPNDEEFYPYKAEALYSYDASSADPRELSFKRGEVLDILTKSDQWWEARKSTGQKGIVPSNYMKIKARVSSVLMSRRLSTMDWSARANPEAGPQVYPYKARAMYSYAASPEYPSELSFKKGEILEILTKDDEWWEARKADGSKGVAPSNYLKEITS